MRVLKKFSMPEEGVVNLSSKSLLLVINLTIKCSLSDFKKYIEVTVSGIIEKAAIIAAISELMQHSEYLHKHSLWELSNATTRVTIGDLKEIANAISINKPKEKKFKNKSAIIVPGHMHKAMIELFIKMANRLPFKYFAFTDNKKAVDFLYSE